jgi:hypothetical protein
MKRPARPKDEPAGTPEPGSGLGPNPNHSEPPAAPSHNPPKAKRPHKRKLHPAAPGEAHAAGTAPAHAPRKRQRPLKRTLPPAPAPASTADAHDAHGADQAEAPVTAPAAIPPPAPTFAERKPTTKAPGARALHQLLQEAVEVIAGPAGADEVDVPARKRRKQSDTPQGATSTSPTRPASPPPPPTLSQKAAASRAASQRARDRGGQRGGRLVGAMRRGRVQVREFRVASMLTSGELA